MGSILSQFFVLFFVLCVFYHLDGLRKVAVEFVLNFILH